MRWFFLLALFLTTPAFALTRAIKLAEGTGFYISHDGYLLTANHVIAHCSSDISLHNEEMVLKAKVVDTNPDYDLALLKIIPKLRIENIAHIRSLRFPPIVGEKVAVAGYPDDTTDLSSEFVSFSTNDAKITNPKGPNGEDKWVMFSYSARPGFSGGPVLDNNGNIIGLTSGGTCISQRCTANFRQALAAVKRATNPIELQQADAQVAANSDTNIAASATAMYLFLAKNGITTEQNDSSDVPNAKQLKSIAESIANVRCTQSDDDFNSSIRVMDIR